MALGLRLWPWENKFLGQFSKNGGTCTWGVPSFDHLFSSKAWAECPKAETRPKSRKIQGLSV